jgi:hypothetical protein
MPPMRMFLLGVPACAMLLTWASGAESRKWTSATGSVMEGKMVELIPDRRNMVNAKIKIETLDGRAITVAFNQLSAPDQAWLANHHGDELAGNVPRNPEPTPLNDKDKDKDKEVRLLPTKTVVSFDPDVLLAPPAGMSFKRAEIPSRGEYLDASSDGANLVTNPLVSKTGN